MAPLQHAATPGSTVVVELLFSLFEPPLALIEQPVALVGAALALVGDLLALLGDALARVGDAISFVRPTRSLFRLVLELLDAVTVRIHSDTDARTTRFPPSTAGPPSITKKLEADPG